MAVHLLETLALTSPVGRQGAEEAVAEGGGEAGAEA